MKKIMMIGLMALALTGCKKDDIQEEFNMEYIKSKIKPDTVVRNRLPIIDTTKKYIQGIK